MRKSTFAHDDLLILVFVVTALKELLTDSQLEIGFEIQRVDEVDESF